MRIKASFLGIALIVLSPFLLMAQLLDPVEYTITETPSEVKAGEVFEVVVKATIEGEWNLYSVLNDPDAGPYPTKFTSGRGDMAVAGAVTESPASIELDPNFNAELGWHSGEAFFTIPVAFHEELDRKSTRLNSSHVANSYAGISLQKQRGKNTSIHRRPHHHSSSTRRR